MQYIAYILSGYGLYFKKYLHLRKWVHISNQSHQVFIFSPCFFPTSKTHIRLGTGYRPSKLRNATSSVKRAFTHRPLYPAMKKRHTWLKFSLQNMMVMSLKNQSLRRCSSFFRRMQIRGYMWSACTPIALLTLRLAKSVYGGLSPFAPGHRGQ